MGESAIAARTPFELFWRRLRHDKVALASGIFILLLILAALFAPLIVKLVGVTGPNVQNPHALDSFGTPTGPSSAHPFGVDQLGRDVFARVLYGARVSLEVAIIATALSVSLGVVAGMISGYFRGAVDTAISRLIDVLLAFPVLLLAIGLASACSLGNGCLGGTIKPGLGVVIFVIVVVGLPLTGTWETVNFGVYAASAEPANASASVLAPTSATSRRALCITPVLS